MFRVLPLLSLQGVPRVVSVSLVGEIGSSLGLVPVVSRAHTPPGSIPFGLLLTGPQDTSLNLERDV